MNNRRVNFRNIADEAVVFPVVAPHPFGLNQAAVDAAQANGAAALSDDRGNKILVDLAAQDTLDDFHCLAVRVSQTFHEFWLFADLSQHIVDFRPAPMDEYNPDPDEVQKNDVLHDRVE